MGDFCDLEFFVVFAQEDGNFAIDVQDFSFVQPTGVFCDVLFVVKEKLFLQGKCPAVILMSDKRPDDGRHPSENQVFTEILL